MLALAQVEPPNVLGPMVIIVIIGLIGLVIFGSILWLMSRYRRCPSNRVLVVYGKVQGDRAAKCIHGGGAFVWPVIQDFAYLSLEPMAIDIELTGALSKKNIRVNVPSTFTIGISVEPEIMHNAAERLLGLGEPDIITQARDIILGQMRLVVATLAIEEINQDREKFLDLVNQNVNTELNKIGLEVINVNIRDITDESGYIEAIGRKAASEAINQAKVEVAQQNRMGAIGETTANKEKEVSVAAQLAESVMGQKEAERNQRISVAKLEAEGVTGEATATRDKEIALAQQKALTEQSKKEAEASQRVRVAELDAQAVQGEIVAKSQQRIKVAQLEADAVKGENESKARIVEYEATLAQRQAEARRKGDVALAEAARDVLRAETAEEVARLEKTELAQKEIDKRKIEIEAEAEAERRRRLGKGEADAILAKFTAEAEGIRRTLEAKADGYRKLMEVCGEHPDMAPTLLMIEKLPELVAEQVKAIQNLKIDKVTVWDGGYGGGANGEGGGNTTAKWLREMVGALPPIHDLARQSGVKLPGILGTIEDGKDTRDQARAAAAATPPTAAPAKPASKPEDSGAKKA